MKNKFFKHMIIIFMLMVTLFSYGLVCAKGAPSTITINYIRDIRYLYSSVESINKIEVNIKKGANGEYIYCVEADKKTLNKNDVMVLDGEFDDAGIIYLAKKGFPNSSITGDNNKDYYITQTAIWLYYRKVYNVSTPKLDMIVNGTYNSNAETREIVGKINELCDGAIKAHNQGIVKPSLSVNSNSALNSYTSDGKYLQSDLVSVNLIGSDTYEVSISNNQIGAMIVDAKGNSKTKFNANEKFRILIDCNKLNDKEFDLSVSIKANATVDKAYRYRHQGDSNKQKALYGALYSEAVELSKAVNFQYKPAPKEVLISKVDVTTGKELPGAHLEIRDSQNNLVASWVSTNTPYQVKLIPGKYTLTETIAPDGYELSTEKVSFEVKEDGTTDKVVMENKPYKEEPKEVLISKVDATTGKELPGAHLEIRDSQNNLVASWVSTNTPHQVKLVPGKYTLTETIAPDGYELSTEKVSFEVKKDGTTDKVVMENKPYKEEPKEVLISKVDVTTGKELPGAHLEIRDSQNNLVASWVSTNTPHQVKLVPGKYTLTETIAPDGYELSTEKVSFEVKKDGTTDKVVMENKPYIDVPITDLNASQITMIMGGVLLSIGLMVVYNYGKKYKWQ